MMFFLAVCYYGATVARFFEHSADEFFFTWLALANLHVFVGVEIKERKSQAQQQLKTRSVVAQHGVGGWLS